MQKMWRVFSRYWALVGFWLCAYHNGRCWFIFTYGRLGKHNSPAFKGVDIDNFFRYLFALVGLFVVSLPLLFHLCKNGGYLSCVLAALHLFFLLIEWGDRSPLLGYIDLLPWLQRPELRPVIDKDNPLILHIQHQIRLAVAVHINCFACHRR